MSAYRVRWRTAEVGTQGSPGHVAAGSWQDADGDDNTGEEVTGKTSYTIEGLVAGTAYDVAVAATNSAGTGSFSSPVEATPAALIVLTITPKQTTRVYGTAQDLGFTVGGLVDGDLALGGPLRRQADPQRLRRQRRLLHPEFRVSVGRGRVLGQVQAADRAGVDGLHDHQEGGDLHVVGRGQGL